jgi:predicted CXXCH cytochrome family protein
VASLQPDASGEWYLLDGDGRQLILRSARYDETPLDCGRAGCHAAIADAAAASPMTTVLARGLTRPSGGAVPAFGAGDPGCAEGCHTVGEPGGVPDGGFSHVASELGEAGAAHTWEDLPRALRRLGGVGCLACHGPAALPEASARWSILRADVCAVCHDAPPRYGQVAAWRQTAMARADRDPRTRIGGACVRCHTTWGFLGTTAARRPPDGAGPVGISCAACHAVHLSPSPPRALLRSGDVCVACHDTDPQGPLPFASAAAIRSGRGGLDPANGAPLVDAAAPAPACTGCHRGHRFTAAPTAAADDVRERARLLWERWAGRPNDTAAPVHAGDLQLDRGTARGRAGWDILMVLEDRGAAAHNAPYARTLLAAAERAMAGGAR